MVRQEQQQLTSRVKAGCLSMCFPCFPSKERLHEYLMQGHSQSVKDRNLQWRSSLCLSVHVMCALFPLPYWKCSELRNNCSRTKHLWVSNTQVRSSGNPLWFEAMMWVHSLWGLGNPKPSHAFELLNLLEIRNQNTFEGLHLSIPSTVCSICIEEKNTFCFRSAKYAEEGGVVQQWKWKAIKVLKTHQLRTARAVAGTVLP